jgi:putative DNA primase/helicase
MAIENIIEDTTLGGKVQTLKSSPSRNVKSQRDESAISDASQDQLAQMFTDLYKHEFQFVAERSCWYHWTGKQWRIERTGLIYDRIRKICKKFATDERLGIPDRRKLLKADFIAGVERLARSDRSHAATSDQWDKDPMLFNTPGGTVDLKTGQLLAHDSSRHITQMGSVTPKEMPTPIWDAFLAKVQPDPNVRAFLDRWNGYALTGKTTEHKLVFNYGGGRNGKGVFQTVQMEIFGTYATSAPMELLVESKFDRHPTEIARLNGPRLVAMSETEEGRRWNESRVKSMTGGDPLTGRFMKQDFFSFIPRFKFFISGNFPPVIRNVDEAIKARLHFVKWPVRIPEEEQDKDLIEKLRPEHAGILFKWIVAGMEWQKNGLQPPVSVNETTSDYLKTEDRFGMWLEECDTSKRDSFSSNDSLYRSWSEWCQREGEYLCGSKTKFTQELEKRGYRRHTDESMKKSIRGFNGIKAPMPLFKPADSTSNVTPITAAK